MACPWRPLLFYLVSLTSARALTLDYQGCFGDSPQRDLSKHLGAFSDNTPETCGARCAAQGYSVVGVQWGRACFCSNPPFGKYGLVTHCNTPCEGDIARTCGGGWANDIYVISNSAPATTKRTTSRLTSTTATTTTATATTTTATTTTATTTTATTTTATTTTATTTTATTTTATTTTPSSREEPRLSYRGCYLDAPQDPDLLEDIVLPTFNQTLAPSLCASLCRDRGYSVMGLQWGDTCWCGRNYGRHGLSTLWPCDERCPGDCSSTCGGPYTNDIYLIS